MTCSTLDYLKLLCNAGRARAGGHTASWPEVECQVRALAAWACRIARELPAETPGYRGWP
jgi:hypothetical protein